MELTLLSPTSDSDSGLRCSLPARSPESPPRIELVCRTRDGDAARPAQRGESAFLARLRHGDEAAYEELVRTYGPRMFAVARRYLPSSEDAEDALQSAFLLVFRFIHRFQGGSRLSTWLHRIVVNCSLMSLRSRSRRHEPPSSLAPWGAAHAAELVADVSEPVVDSLERREAGERMLSAVARLPDRLGLAVRLHDVNGLSFEETSAVLRSSVAAARTSVHRGHVALRRMLSSNGTRERPHAGRRGALLQRSLPPIELNSAATARPPAD